MNSCQELPWSQGCLHCNSDSDCYGQHPRAQHGLPSPKHMPSIAFSVRSKFRDVLHLVTHSSVWCTSTMGPTSGVGFCILSKLAATSDGKSTYVPL